MIGENNIGTTKQYWVIPNQDTLYDFITHYMISEIKNTEVVFLSGPVGVGKTTFVRAVIQSLTRSSEIVPSPTFTLVQTFETCIGIISHFDLFRLSDPRELRDIGWEEARDNGIVFVEWPDRLGSLSPRKRLEVQLRFFTLCDMFTEGRWLCLERY